VSALRQLTTCVIALALLNVNAARADASCATHDPPATGMPVDVQEHPPGHHDAPAEPEECQTPSQPECCLALAACSISLGAASVQDARSMVDRAGAIAYLTQLPASRSSAPEPPPPRV
jgi:hypothetical protein